MKNLALSLVLIFSGCSLKAKMETGPSNLALDLDTVIKVIQDTPIPNEISEELYNFSCTSPEFFSSTLRQAREVLKKDIICRLRLLGKEECATPNSP